MTSLTLYLIIFSIILYLFVNRNKRKNLKIPGPNGIPIFGNLLSLSGEMHLTLQEWYKTYGSVFSIRMGNIDTVVLTEYPTIRKAFVDNSLAFASRYQLKSRVVLTGAKDLAIQNGEIHSLLKKVVLSEMTTTKIKRMEIHIIKETEKILKILDKHAERGEPFIINNYLNMFSMNVILRFLLGIDYPYENVDETVGYVKSIKSFFAVAGLPILSDFIPIPLKKSGVFFDSYKELEIETDKLIEKFKKSRNEKIENGTYNEEEDESILSKLLKEYEHGNITWECVSHTCIDIISAGTDTSANTLVMALIELINNQEIQSKAFSSIRSSCLNDSNDDDDDDEIVITHSKYRSLLPYISMIIKETFRKHPIALLGLPHVTTEDVEIDGYKIEAGTYIIQNIFSSHRSDKIFQSPNEFIPERFFESSQNQGLIHFGLGVRDCVGKSLAECEIFTLIATLLNRYQFINPNNSKKLNDIGTFGLAQVCPDTNIILKKRI
ncbi:cytochrome P450 family protein [Dictyostelium discoideum AX4]|uniref:Probable cytochrome P450 513A3 n=1 Tax=Dictyostelium discoideum TaxID=44689 RepID=C5133_DICDI|nr:cytochrome P450 family protein [Dictyostelium discoideum AX4]Q55BU9.1 RecName: Full=Probable cytochrome P450 513A3 [Dictyostelium discoideum]EAL72527.1 cytochrome P450 family protein [Dictyostelium discoideum AX4]|eukprot:XP_646732.1 cytochrome P450 family protein [Dictyostelium discoideum AX4]